MDWDNLNNIKETLNSFIGKQEQIPPMYSAIKVNGKKLYEYARNGQTVEISPRKIEIYDIELQEIEKELNEIKFKVSCSKGTYIRSLCDDIAKKMGTIGYMKELNRTKVGRFEIQNSITIDELENNKINVEEKIITMEELFKELPIINLKKEQLEKFLNGVKINIKLEDGIYNIYEEKYIGLGIIKDNKLKRDIIL